MPAPADMNSLARPVPTADNAKLEAMARENARLREMLEVNGSMTRRLLARARENARLRDRLAYLADIRNYCDRWFRPVLNGRRIDTREHPAEFARRALEGE